MKRLNITPLKAVRAILAFLRPVHFLPQLLRVGVAAYVLAFGLVSCVSSSTVGYNHSAPESGTYAVGDIVFADGDIIHYSSGLSLTDAQKKKAYAVIFYVGDDSVLGDRVLGVGLHNSRGDDVQTYKWAVKDTVGYNTKFASIQCTRYLEMPDVPYYKYESMYPISYSPLTFSDVMPLYLTGDFDGSDNWAEICKVDADAEDNAATNYPAFNYVNTYAENQGLEGICAEGWYMPSGAELLCIYKNLKTVNAAIAACGGTEITEGYWSSSQVDEDGNDNDYYAAWGLLMKDYFNRHQKDHFRQIYEAVCCIREF